MKRLVYADNAATTQMDADVFEAMRPYFLEYYGNASQPYSFSRTAKDALNWSREIIASCINASPNEVYFTSGGSESDNWVIKGSSLQNFSKGAVITSAFEHHAILHSCAAIERLGFPVAYMLPNRTGYITSEILESYITEKTFLVSIMFANNEIGTVQPIKELAEIAHSNHAYFHTDAVQAVGHIDINVRELNVDYLSASAHKFNGPKGIGFLYIKSGSPLPTFIDGGAQESALRAGTENIAAIVGMAVALKSNCQILEQNQKRIKSLENRLLSKIHDSGISFIRNGGEPALPGLISISFPHRDGEAILHRMDLMGISISTGSACDSKNTEISHVLKAIQLDDVYAKGTIRISLGKNNTEEDVDQICRSLIKIVN